MKVCWWSHWACWARQEQEQAVSSSTFTRAHCLGHRPVCLVQLDIMTDTSRVCLLVEGVYSNNYI